MRGAAILALACGAVGGLVAVVPYVFVQSILTAVPYSDRLSFVGAIFGLMGAVLVAGLVPLLHSWRREQTSMRHIKEAATDLIATLNFEGVGGGDVAEGRWQRALVGVERISLESGRLSHLSHDQFVKVRRLELAMERLNARIERGRDQIEPLNFEFYMGEDRDQIVQGLRDLRTLFE